MEFTPWAFFQQKRHQKSIKGLQDRQYPRKQSAVPVTLQNVIAPSIGVILSVTSSVPGPPSGHTYQVVDQTNGLVASGCTVNPINRISSIIYNVFPVGTTVLLNSTTSPPLILTQEQPQTGTCT